MASTTLNTDGPQDWRQFGRTFQFELFGCEGFVGGRIFHFADEQNNDRLLAHGHEALGHQQRQSPAACDNAFCSASGLIRSRSARAVVSRASCDWSSPRAARRSVSRRHAQSWSAR